MNKLRELINEQPSKICRIAARAFIAELKEINMNGYKVVIAYCDSAIQDLDLVNIALNSAHYEERAKMVLTHIEEAMAYEVRDYIQDKKADFQEEDELEDMDDSEPLTVSGLIL